MITNKLRSDSPLLLGSLAAAVLLLLGGLAWLLRGGHEPAAATAPNVSSSTAPRHGKVAQDTVQIGGEQAAALDIGPVGERSFSNQRKAIGNIDFNQDRTVPVFTAYQGRIASVLVKAGDDVKAGQTLYTVNVPDIAQAATALISSAATLRNANETLRRARVLAGDNSIPQKELQQNESDQLSAEANYNAARKSLRLFGLSDGDIARIERDHAIDIEMPVRSPIAGRVTSRLAQVGLLVQPGNAPAPVTVSDMRTLWMMANVPESELALYKIGQPVSVRVQAYPDKTYAGRVSYVGDSVDANSRRLVVRADISDPAHELRPQMLADFSITVAAPVTGVAAPATAVVRESDGSNVVWIASDADTRGVRLVRRKVELGRTDGGQVQITGGLRTGERIARTNALFLSNLYATDTQ
jgi:cobalt-zinc-cadmium efflux system membrane fusion protein